MRKWELRRAETNKNTLRRVYDRAYWVYLDTNLQGFIIHLYIIKFVINYMLSVNIK